MIIFYHYSDSIPRTPLHSAKLDQKCACGCELTEPEGEIIATGRCTGLSRWRMTASVNKIIRISFQYFELFSDRQWVKVRNGDNSKSDLLAVSYGQGELLTEVTSTSNKLLVEFMTKGDNSSRTSYSPFSTNKDVPHPPASITSWQPTRRIHVYGFIAMYTTFGKFYKK